MKPGAASATLSSIRPFMISISDLLVPDRNHREFTVRCHPNLLWIVAEHRNARVGLQRQGPFLSAVGRERIRLTTRRALTGEIHGSLGTNGRWRNNIFASRV